MRLFLYLICFIYIKNIYAYPKLSDCDSILPRNLIVEIQSYQAIANQIINEILTGRFQNVTYNDLADFGDKFGNRLAGTKNLEKSIDYVITKLKDSQLDNVHGENVTVPYWERGEESAELILPRYQKLNMLGLGSSVGTPANGLTAEVVVFGSFAEMAANADKVPGKIVVFAEKYESYGKTVQYRSRGASKAAQLGAVAVLIASITPFSLNTPHTGILSFVPVHGSDSQCTNNQIALALFNDCRETELEQSLKFIFINSIGLQTYDKNVKKIPAACITTADANMLYRMYKRGVKIVIKITMSAKNLPDAISRNVIADITGTDKSEQLVIVSGHIDSWDVGQGVMDDGAGAFIAFETLRVLKKLKLQARRTMRAILWTGEEEGLIGAFEYFKTQNISNINFIMESDIGTFKPIGFDFAGNALASCIFREIQKLLHVIDVNQFNHLDTVGSDITIWTSAGVPGASLATENERYFWYHHSDADTMDVENPHELDLCTATWAIVTYVIANLNVDMPKTINYEYIQYLLSKDRESFVNSLDHRYL